MRFVFTAPRFHTNQRYAFKALLDAGHEVTVLALRRGQSEAYDVLSPRVLGCSRVFDILRRLACVLPRVSWSDIGGVPPIPTFWLELRRLRPCAVVVRNPSSGYGRMAMLAARLTGNSLILYNQLPRHREVSLPRRVMQAILLRLTGAAWFTPVLGDSEKHPMTGLAPRYVPFVMEPQIAPDERRWFADGCVNILHVGKFQPRKNHRMFLEAVAALSPRYEIRATIVGECSTPTHLAELEAVTQLRARLGLEDIVEVETNVPHLQMNERYAGHDLFVLASRNEPAAVSHLEAMAHGLPVICSDANGTSCYVRHGENGYVFRSGDVDDLAACIERAIEDRGLLAEMGRRSYELVLTEHAPARYVNALVEMAGRSALTLPSPTVGEGREGGLRRNDGADAPRVAVFVASLRGGGAERAMLDIARGLSDRGLAVDLVLVKAVGEYLDLVPPSIRVIDLDSSRAIRSFPQFARYLRRERPSVLISTMPEVNVVAIAARALLARDTALIARRTNTYTMQLKYSGFKTRLTLRLERQLLRIADAIVKNSQEAADDLARTAPRLAPLTRVIRNPVVWPYIVEKAAEPIAHPWLNDSSLQVVLAAGRLAPQKDHATLLRAFANVVLKSRPAARLVILGEGSQRSELCRLAEELDVAECVDFPGFVMNPFAYMSKASVFALTSLYEGSPNVLVQAMACGTPVVSTDCHSGPREILQGGALGRLVLVGDWRALGEAILQTLENPVQSACLIDGTKEYSAENSVQQYFGLLTKLLESKARM